VHRFAPYLFDRLIDAPDAPRDGVGMTWSVAQLEQAVVRDVEALLNTRRTIGADVLDPHPLVQRSILGYGLDDFSSLGPAGANDRALICRRIEAAITNHEPRLQRVQVALDPKGASAQQIRFSIKALLCVAPLKQPVDFDAVLEATTQHYAVSSARPAR
jgi:type VI secretion system protein ImpF